MLMLLTNSCSNIKTNYSMKPSEQYGKSITISVDDNKISTILPKYKKELSAISIFKNDDTLILPIYSYLCERGSLKENPQAFDDITGDGQPDLVCIERQTAISNHGAKPVVVRIFTFNGINIEEYPPTFMKMGEALHFDDFNKDGVLELVNTDNERDFKYSTDGMPESPYVYIFDTIKHQYKNDN